MKSIALITGATSGFGKAIAEKFAKQGYDIIITGRRNEKLNEAAQEIQNNYSVKVLALNFDVRDKSAVDKELNNLPAEWKNINVLVNNAGLALGREYFDEANIDDWDTMIDTNLKGLLYVTRAVLPYLKNNPYSHIINISSIAAKQVYEKRKCLLCF